MRSGGNLQIGQRWHLDHDGQVAVGLAIVGGGLWLSDHAFVSTALLAGALAMALWRPVGAFWATCAAIPLIFHPVSIGSFEFSLLEIGILMAFIGTAVRLLSPHPLANFTTWLRTEPYLIVWWGGSALLLIGALSIFSMPELSQRDVALRNMRWVIVEPLMAFVVARHAIRCRGASSVVLALTLPASVVAAASVIDIVLGDGFEADGISRATGPYLHPNNLALYLERIFVLFAGMVISRSALANPANVLMGGTIALGLFATFSRGMVPAVAAGLVVIGWLINNRKLMTVAFAAFVVGLSVFALAASDRLGGTSVAEFLGERRYIWRAASAKIADYPASGIGLDQFLYHHVPRYIAPEAWSERYISHPHNIVLDSWLSLGAPGLILLVGGIVALAVAAWSSKFRAGELESIRIAAMAALTTGLVHGLVDNGYFLPDLAVLTWILIAMIVSRPSERNVPPEVAPLMSEAPS